MDDEQENECENLVKGYGTVEALTILYEELSNEIENFEAKLSKQKWKNIFMLMYPKNVKSAFHLTSMALILILMFALVLGYIVGDESYIEGTGWWLAESITMIFFVSFNFGFNLWNAHLESYEHIQMARLTLQKLLECINNNSWNKDNYPHLHCPLSPCVSLQWTLRDNEVVNVPVPLLVKGDIIIVRPGQQVPAACRELEETEETQDTVLEEGTVYSPRQENGDKSNLPNGRTPIIPCRFLLLETPFVKYLRMVLEDNFERPVSTTENDRYLISTVWIERRLLPCVLIAVLVINIMRSIYFKGHTGHWAEMILVLPVHSVIPILPLLFPILWRLLNYYGQARVFAAFDAAKDTKMIASEDSFSSDSSISEDEARVDIPWSTILSWFWAIFVGNVPVVTRRVNITHTLGSVTSLCCIDKKGILSWPNPTAEKIFFLSSLDKQVQETKNAEESFQSPDHSVKVEKSAEINMAEKPNSSMSTYGYFQPSHVEVLDLTHYAKNSFGLRFDDPSYQKHLSSLKPLGLNILANTCNEETVDWYTQFTDHVACEALENKDTVAVVNRRCLCELAKQIGFSEKALDIFSLEKILGLYKHVSAEESTKEKIHRAQSFIHHKIPMPNMVSTIVKEKTSGICQLLSQGTADLLLECSSDYWNGEDLCPLTENDRKKIIDFYHRASMAAYCTAFSYRPLTQQLAPHLEDVYIHLPEDCSGILPHHDTTNSFDPDLGIPFETRMLWDSSRTFSVDSLFDTASMGSVEDITGCFQAQCNQIFIGMVTMQYQARQDFVQLIDKLEVACIRFVHFSQENEVRSRVFSEKMGLEAGWNCHISLLSDDVCKADLNPGSGSTISQTDIHRGSHYSSRHSSETAPKDIVSNTQLKFKNPNDFLKKRSQSAPSIVNLDPSQVRFEMKVSSSCITTRTKKKRSDDSHESTPLTFDEDVVFTDNEANLPMYTREKSQNDSLINSDIIDNMTDIGSRHTSSYITENTEDSLTGALDNRAKLPRGIENIRPHLEHIDNVPLLVNLFTDCTVETTQEMIKIMQENGQVVLCVGSSVNMLNTAIFLQSDCSVAVEPLLPQVCAKKPAIVQTRSEHILTPTQLAAALISIPCPMGFKLDDHIGAIHFIAEARSYLMAMRNCFYLMLCYHLAIMLGQVVSSLLLFPPVLSSQHLLWLIFIIIPVLCVSLMGIPVDPRVMNNATSKNSDPINRDMVVQFLGYFVLRFIPAVFVCLFCYGLTLHSFCIKENMSTGASVCTLYAFSDYNATETRFWYDKFSGGLIVAQNVFLFLLVLYFVCISVSFVHWSDHLWQHVPFTNKFWSIVTPVLCISQIIFFACDVVLRNNSVRQSFSLSDIHPAVYAVGFCFPVIILVVNELVKKHEVKLYVRYQKRTRLNFGTKLGMNSPF